MSFLSSTTTYPLTIFRGTTATLLRAGGVQVPAGFAAEDVVLTAQLDRSSYKLVSRSPLLHTEILLEVGNRMATKVAPELAAEYRRSGSVAKDGPVLSTAAKQAPLWVSQTGGAHKAGLRRWRKAKFDAGVKCTTCVLGLAGAGAGLASAAASFGATSIPAVFGAWSAVSTTIGALAGAWRDVQTSEANALRHLRKMQQAYGAQLMPQQAGGVVPGAGPQKAPGRFHRAGSAAKQAGNIVASGLKLDPLFNGRSMGPSVAGFRSAMDEYEVKLSHLAREADKLTLILTDLLDINTELAASTDPDDAARLATNETLAARIIGDENGAGGISRKRDAFRKPVSILWLREYYRVGRALAQTLRDQAATLLRQTTMNRLDAREKGGAFGFSLANWFGGQTDALASGSLIGFATGVGVLTDDGGLSVMGVAKVLPTLSDWGGQVGGIVDALRHKYPDEAKSSLAKECKMDYLGGAQEVGLAAFDTYGGISGAVGG